MKLEEIERNYIETLDNLHLELKNSYNKTIDYKFDLNTFEITNSLLLRLKHFYKAQYLNKALLDKKYIMAGADYFTEQLLYFLKIFLYKNRPELKVYSEKQIKPSRGSIRPDISIWKNDEIVAIIECKTQLGWNRHKWESDFINRELKLKKTFKNANAYLVVLTGENWAGFEENELLGEKYFCLLKDKWVPHYENEKDIYIEIEKLFKKIILV